MHSCVIRTIIAAAGACAACAGALGETLSIEASSALALQPEESATSQATGVAPVLEVRDHWDFDLDAIYWAPWDVNADATVNGALAAININPDDLLDDDQSYGPQIRFEAWNSSGWGVIVNATYLSFEADGAPGSQGGVPLPTLIDSEVEWLYVDLQAGVRLLDSPPDSTGFGAAKTDLLAGVRYGYVDIEHVAQSNQQKIQRDDDYIEPAFAIRNSLSIRDDLWWTTRLDLSGGGGQMTDLTWMIDTGIEWELKNRLELIAGYRIVDIDYDQGDNFRKVGLDGRFHGPYFGLRFAF